MKKYIFISVFLFLNLASAAKTIHVGKQQRVTTIQQALLLALDGDTVLVDPGLYREKNIIIKRSVFLIGIGHPVLDGEDTYEVISIKADNVMVNGKSFTPVYQALRIMPV